MKLRKKLAVLGLVGIMGATAGFGTLAYFTDSDSAKNEFTVGDLDITLSEDGWTATPEGGNIFTSEGATNFVPGRTIAKKPIVKLEAGSVPTYVRLVVEASEDAIEWFAFEGVEGKEVKEQETTTLVGGRGDGAKQWTLIGSSTAGGVIYQYNSILKDGESTAPLFTGVTVNSALTQDDIVPTASVSPDFDITVKAYGVQVEGFEVDSTNATMDSQTKAASAAFAAADIAQ